jgi:hypothetical protein
MTKAAIINCIIGAEHCPKEFRMKTYLRIIAICMHPMIGFGIPMGAGEVEQLSTSALLKAPIIVLGRITSLEQTGRVTVQQATPVAVSSCGAFLSDVTPIRGQVETTVHIGGILRAVNPWEDQGWQRLESNKTYVVFLQRGSADGLIVPISVFQFALEVERIPKAIPEDASQSLRAIAKENILTATNRFVVIGWTDFLMSMFDPVADTAFWTSKLADPNLAMRGKALLALAENTPTLAGVYSNVLSFLHETATNPAPLGVRHRLAELLPAMAEVNSGNLKQWIGNDAREVKQTALKAIRETRDASLATGVVDEMMKTNDRELQYDCIKTLCSLNGGRLIAYPEFIKRPDAYIQEWQNRAVK